VRACLAVLWKDLLCEWRSRDRIVAMLVFSTLVVVVFHFALPEGAGRQTRAHAPGLLWVATVFAALLGLGRAFALELENDALAGLALAPAERGWIFLGKWAANVAILAVVQAVTALVFAVVFAVDLAPVLGRFALVAALGSVGLCAIGTLSAAVAVRTRFRELLLPLLVLPLLWPVLSGAVRATAALLETGSVPFEPIQLLLVTDATYLILSFLSFEYVLEE
jgi:heme exporter protein B